MVSFGVSVFCVIAAGARLGGSHIGHVLLLCFLFDQWFDCQDTYGAQLMGYLLSLLMPCCVSIRSYKFGTQLGRRDFAR